MTITSVEWETYGTPDGGRRVNIGEHSYALCGPDGGWRRRSDGGLPAGTIEGRQLEFVRTGSYGQLARIWLDVCEAHGLQPRFGWKGIINELGDHDSVSPAFPPKPRNHNAA